MATKAILGVDADDDAAMDFLTNVTAKIRAGYKANAWILVGSQTKINLNVL